MNKASRGDGIPVEPFQIFKDDAVKVLHLIWQQIWKTQQWPQDCKRSVFIPIPKKGKAKECSKYRTIALSSHASNVMLSHFSRVWLSDPMDCSPPGFSIHRIFQAKVLEWGAIAFFVMLVKWWSKFSNQGFNSTWALNFQMFKLVLGRQRPNWQHSLDHWKSKRVPEKHLFLLYWLCQSLWLRGSQ